MRVALRPGTADQAPRRTDVGGSGASGAFQPLLQASHAGTAQRAAATGATLAVAAPWFLAVQEAADRHERRRQAVRRGEDLLSALDGLHRALLGGEASPDAAAALAGEVRRRCDASDDPALDRLLKDIELRCEVELAKLEFHSTAS